MKTRIGFVSNSSSSSFLAGEAEDDYDNDEELLEKINYIRKEVDNIDCKLTDISTTLNSILTELCKFDNPSHIKSQSTS